MRASTMSRFRLKGAGDFMPLAVLGIGTNIGDRLENIYAAVAALRHLPGTNVKAVSGIYQTTPVGYSEQPDFFNADVLVDTQLSAHALLGACLGIEAAMGRVRQFTNGPRIIDLDLVLYGEDRICDAELTVPHPRMGERAFVLVPLLDLFPDGNAFGFNIREMLSALPEGGVEKVNL